MVGWILYGIPVYGQDWYAVKFIFGEIDKIKHSVERNSKGNCTISI